jgi:hypothetical protein
VLLVVLLYWSVRRTVELAGKARPAAVDAAA